MKTTVLGREIEYGVDERTGMFGATWNGERYEHQTLSGLKAALTRQLKHKPLNVKVIRVQSDGVMDDQIEVSSGLVVGVHSGNGNLLVKWDGEDGAEQYNSYRSELLVGTWTPNACVRSTRSSGLHKPSTKSSNTTFGLTGRC